MYVIPEARGRGVARLLLVALEERGRELGYTIARLDTGPKQPSARHLYESAGYAAIPNFNGNPVATFFGEQRLGRHCPPTGDARTTRVSQSSARPGLRLLPSPA